ncbi:MAG: hypothetical protein RL088_829 [Verrucomicrobiota bacterium]
MTQSHRGARLLAILAALAFAIIPARAQVLNSQEQAVANLLTTAGGQLRNKSVMRLDPALAAVARARAKDMAVRGYFAHVNPSGKGPNYLVRAAGFPLPAWWGTDPTDNTIESISAGLSSASQTWSSLLDSTPHRTHLLATQTFYRDQTDYGIGYYYDAASQYRHYWVIITAPPRALSTLTITSPIAGAVVTGSNVPVSGTVGGSELTGWFEIRVENAAGNGAWLRPSVPGGRVIGNWQASLPGFVAGNNVVLARSYTDDGTLLTETTRTVRWAVLKPLTVSISGNGKVTSGFSGTTQREVGVSYTLTAEPLDSRTLFSHWSVQPGDKTVQTARYTFRMEEGVSLVANFKPNPFWALRGSYQVVTAGSDAANSAQVQFTLTSGRSFTGRLIHESAVYAFTGVMTRDGIGTVNLRTVTGEPITLTLTADLEALTPVVAARIVDSNTDYSVAAERRMQTGPGLPPGAFNLAIRPDINAPGTPTGFGYARIVVEEFGTVKVAGKLADGTPFTAKTIVTNPGVIPIFARIFSGSGAVVGNLQLASTETTDVEGSVSWFKPERPLAPIYPQVFATRNVISGSRYLPPSAATPAVDFQTANNTAKLTLAEGNLGSEITQSLRVQTNNSITLELPAQPAVTVSLNPANGRFSGSFLHPVEGLKKFSGLMDQKQRAGRGFFLGSTESGVTQIAPQP